jgi:hypothetical protein
MLDIKPWYFKGDFVGIAVRNCDFEQQELKRTG